MLEYARVESPVFFPAACVCGSQDGPLIDTFIERYEMRVYVCLRCVERMTRVMGGLVAEERAELEVRLADAADREAELRGLLKEARRGVVSDVLEFLDREGGGNDEVSEYAREGGVAA